ncbi:unnamed protein product [Effrenium voratum]|nr:unnamed protein product [Effrenium voratum]
MVSPAMLKGMNTEIYGEGHPFGDPSWYQAYNTPYYNDSHKKFRKIMREYVDEHIMSNVHDWDEKGVIPKEMYLEAGKQGTLGLCIGRPWPEKYFGPSPWGFEPDYFHELIMYDEMSRTGSVGFQWGIAGGTTIGLPPVYHHGSEELKQRVMPACVKGEKVCCLAITEPTAGSDVANLKCTAKLEGDHYILNGEKKWITNGIFADYFTVACRTGKPGVGGISLLLVEKGMPGLETRKMKCSGAWSSGTTYITFDDVKVPKGNLLGKEGKGFQYMMQNFNHERFAFCAMSTRFARVCLEESLKFAGKRKTFGKTLIQHPVIRFKVAEMARQVEATHNWLEWITYQLNTMPKLEAMLKLGGHTALCKVQCTKVMEYCAREAAQIFGGLSYSRGGQGEKVERLNREVRAMAIPGGSEEIMLDLGVKQSTKLAQMAKMFAEAAPQPQAYNTPYYNDSHKKFRKIMREYVDEHIMSNVHDWDEKGVIPKEMYLEAGKQGTLGLCIGRPWPEKYFGPSPWGFEPDYFHELIMYDEMSRTGSVGFQWGIAGGTTIGLPPVYHHGSEELKQRVMPACVKGEKVCCLAITEPTAGSDVANLKCTAKLEGDHYILNGEKKWITNGIFADYFTVACRTGKPGVGGISLLLVEKGMPGLETRKMKCSGAWSSGTTYITFDDVKVPKGNLLGKEGKGFQYMMQNFNHERFAFCAMSTRFARVCLEESLKFAGKRKTFGKTLIQHPVIRFKVAEMARQVEATHNWLEWITYQLNTMPKLEAMLKLGGHTALCKVQCTKVMEYCAREAAQIFGGLSYSRGGQGEKVERLNREVRAMAIPGGSEEIMLDLGVKQSTKLAQMAKMFAEAAPQPQAAKL